MRKKSLHFLKLMAELAMIAGETVVVLLIIQSVK